MDLTLAAGGFVLSLGLGFVSGLVGSYKLFFRPFKDEIKQVTNHHDHEISELKEKVVEIDVVKNDILWIRQFLESEAGKKK